MTLTTTRYQVGSSVDDVGRTRVTLCIRPPRCLDTSIRCLGTSIAVPVVCTSDYTYCCSRRERRHTQATRSRSSQRTYTNIFSHWFKKMAINDEKPVLVFFRDGRSFRHEGHIWSLEGRSGSFAESGSTREKEGRRAKRRKHDGGWPQQQPIAPLHQ